VRELKENRKGRYRKEEQEVKEKRKGEGKERKVSQITYWKFNSKYLKTILLRAAFRINLQRQRGIQKVFFPQVRCHQLQV
jgi:hypothetical protein